MVRILFAVLLLTTINVYCADIIFPLEEAILTGSFGEFRGNHLHAGIDLSTGGVEGKKIYAPSDGWVSYVKQDFTGYGNTLFVEDENYIYVFAHLQRFSDKISSLLSEKRFRQLHYPQKMKINVKKGELIGYSGSSGTKDPHLHFEIRSKKNNPLNPLSFYKIEDSEFPEIFGVLFECASDTTLINGKHDNVYMQATKIDKQTYKLAHVNIHGPFTLSVKVIDRANSPSSRLFIYQALLYSNESLSASFTLDSISFDLNARSPLFFRGELPIKNSNYVFSFKKPFDNFLYDKYSGILYPNVDTLLSVVLTDNNSNTSRCDIPVKNSAKPKSERESFVKLKKVNGKVTLIMSGSYAKYNVSEKVKTHFFEYVIDNRYKYYVYERFGETENGFSVDGLKVNENIVHIDSSIIHYFSDSISIKSSTDISFLYSRREKEKSGMDFASDIFEIKLCDQILSKPAYLILNGYNGYSLYTYLNGVHNFSQNLSGSDTVKLFRLKSFVIAKDQFKPIHLRIKRTYSGKYEFITYHLSDAESGIDWNFIADSNDLYIEPNISKSTAKVRLEKNSKEMFVIKDKEGNKDTIYINH